MDKIEAQARMLNIQQREKIHQITPAQAKWEMEQLRYEIKKSTKMTSEEKKQIGKTILKYVLELIIQIITLFIPAMCGKSIMKIRK